MNEINAKLLPQLDAHREPFIKDRGNHHHHHHEEEEEEDEKEEDGEQICPMPLNTVNHNKVKKSKTITRHHKHQTLTTKSCCHSSSGGSGGVTVTNSHTDMSGHLIEQIEDDQRRYEQPVSLMSSSSHGGGSSINSDTEESFSGGSSSSSSGNKIKKSHLAVVSDHVTTTTTTTTTMSSQPQPQLHAKSMPNTIIAAKFLLPTKKKNNSLNDHQKSVLISYFDQNDTPSLETRRSLANELNLESDKVKSWFSNRRNRFRKKSLNIQTIHAINNNTNNNKNGKHLRYYFLGIFRQYKYSSSFVFGA
jgi:hypothetical protein